MIIDIVVGLVVLASALISFMRGFIREVLTIFGVVGGVLAALFLGPQLAPTVRGWFGVVEGEDTEKLFDIIPMDIVADATTYGLIFIAVVIVLSIISHMVSGAAKAMGLGPVDRTLGVIFGIARAAVLLGLAYLPFHLLMDQERKDEFFADSRTHYFIEQVSTAMAGYLPESENVEATVKDSADDLIKRRLEDQDLLGRDRDNQTDGEESPPQPSDATAPDDTGAGYRDEQREKLDQLFSEEPAVLPPTTNE